MNNSPQSTKDSELEIGHVLFMDVVGYSKLLVNDPPDAFTTSNYADFLYDSTGRFVYVSLQKTACTGEDASSYVFSADGATSV